MFGTHSRYSINFVAFESEKNLIYYPPHKWASLVAHVVKNMPAMHRPGFDPWVGKIPWRRIWQPTPVFLPGESHGHRSLGGYSSWGCKESDTTEWLTLCLFTSPHIWYDFPHSWKSLKELYWEKGRSRQSLRFQGE